MAEHPGCILLLVVSLPGMSGLEVARRLAARGDEVLILMVSAREDREAILEAFAAGARGYVTKAAEPEQLFTAIDVVARGGSALSTAAAGSFGEGVRRLAITPGAFEQRRLTLTDRELAILRLLATPRSPTQIAAELHVSRKTVQNHLAAITRKLRVRSRSEAVVKGMEAHLIGAEQ